MVKGQGYQGQKAAFFSPFGSLGAVPFMFGTTSVALVPSIYCGRERCGICGTILWANQQCRTVKIGL